MQTQIIPTTLRAAFEQVKVAKNINANMPIVDVVYSAIMGKQGYIKRNDSNYSLSFATYQKLKAEGAVS